MLRCSVAVFLLLTVLSFFSFTDPQPKKPSALRTIIIDPGHGLPDPGAQGAYSSESQITLALGLKLRDRLLEVLPETNILITRTDEGLPAGLTDRNKANRYRADYANDNKGDLFIAIHVNSAAPRYERRLEGYKEETYYVTTGKGKSKKKVEKTRKVPIYKSYKLSCNVRGTETYIWAVNKQDQKQQAINRKDDHEQYFEAQDSAFSYFDSPEAKIFASLRTKKYFDQSRNAAALVEEEFKKLGRNSFGVKQRNHEGIWVLQATNMPSILVETGFICTPDEEDYLNSEKGQNELTYAMMRAVLRYKEALDSAPEASKSVTRTK
ncbi:N-acetylmuramoyl-L-alanine amidase family protein [Aridibaculum aurantiacum]|uniref:N-acetylmuramoyl-L-alanine amidase family protein n=1 Tax=Aridibaculum aurantiacum TaxID=2810307 RepID=UPI001A9651C2|nr:N-acetylmuramoyl-L-alanine amidase [Aridibaculum aurantiacum]